ncbi:MAG: UDP-2,3-diacylglucosamine diphosphatase [Campylobacterota bacterium]
MIEIEQGDIFIADAHYSPVRPQLERFLDALEAGELTPKRIFWMGDIFDLLVGGIKPTMWQNARMIERINALPMQQYYFEGNHDFNLSRVFPNITVYARKTHPVRAKLGEKTVLLAHGDIYTPKAYERYIRTITDKTVLKILNAVNIKGWITARINAYNYAKNLCTRINNFKTITDNRLTHYAQQKADIVIEGHFHQNMQMQKHEAGMIYCNLPAFVCNQSFIIVKSNTKQLFYEQELRSNNGHR